MPARKDMIERYLDGRLLTLDEIELDKSPTWIEKIHVQMGGKPPAKAVSYGNNPELLDKHRVLAITKSDMLDDELTEALRQELPKDKLSDGTLMPCLFISSVAGKGIQQLKDTLWKALNS